MVDAMNRAAFEHYLRHTAGLEGKTVTDVASRCLRVERQFALDLDQVLAEGRIDSLIAELKSREGRKRMDYVGPDKKWYNALVLALRRYAQFRQDEARASTKTT